MYIPKTKNKMPKISGTYQCLIELINVFNKWQLKKCGLSMTTREASGNLKFLSYASANLASMQSFTLFIEQSYATSDLFKFLLVDYV